MTKIVKLRWVEINFMQDQLNESQPYSEQNLNFRLKCNRMLTLFFYKGCHYQLLEPIFLSEVDFGVYNNP